MIPKATNRFCICVPDKTEEYAIMSSSTVTKDVMKPKTNNFVNLTNVIFGTFFIFTSALSLGLCTNKLK